MLPANMICFVALSLFCGLMLWAAASDFRHFIIPNQVSLGALALFPVYVMSAPAAVQWQWSLAIAIILFTVVFGLYLVGAIGAGDAKLLPVVVLWTGPKHLVLFILALALSSVILSGIMALRAAAAQMKSGAITEAAGDGAAAELSGSTQVRPAASGPARFQLLKVKLPYGVAIAAAGISVAINAMFTTVR